MLQEFFAGWSLFEVLHETLCYEVVKGGGPITGFGEAWGRIAGNLNN